MHRVLLTYIDYQPTPRGAWQQLADWPRLRELSLPVGIFHRGGHTPEAQTGTPYISHKKDSPHQNQHKASLYVGCAGVVLSVLGLHLDGRFRPGLQVPG